MALDRLPVYNRTRMLFLQLEASTKKLPINIKRGYLAKTEEAVISVLEHLAFADEAMADPRRRLAFIAAAQKIMRKVEIRVRIMYDLHYIKKSGLSALMLIEDDVMRQLAGWYLSTEKEIEKENNILPDAQ